MRILARIPEFRECGFDSFFCVPGRDGEHEKGGVEGEIGRFRRRHLVPAPPAVASLAALNQLISTGDMADDGRVITGRPVTIAAAFAEEQRAMGPLPGEPFDPARLLQARVDGRARVCVRQNYYSVPGRYAGRRLPVRLSATTVEVLDGPQMAARHERAAGRYGDAAGTRALIEVLLAHRTLPAAAIEAAMARAVASGVLDAQAVIIDARRRAGPAGRAGHPARRGMPHPNANGNNSAVLSPLSPLAVPLSPRGPSAAPASSVRMPTSRLSTTHACSRVGSAAASSDLASSSARPL